MTLSIILFVLGTKYYKRDDEKKKTGSIITKTFMSFLNTGVNKVAKK